MDIKAVKKVGELLGPEWQDSPYVFSNFISIEKMRQRMNSKKKLKLLKVIDPTLRCILRPEEQVFYVTQGLRVSSVEQVFIGWVSYYYNMMAFVFTSERILLIHMRGNRTRGIYLGAIEYTDIRRVKSSFTGSFTIRFVNGKSMLFTKIPKADRVYIRDFLKSVLVNPLPKNRALPDIRNLCPHCFTEIRKVPEKCPMCETAFKSPLKAGLLSLLMPGLGDLYLCSFALGGLELIFMLFIWFSIISGIVNDAQAGENIADVIGGGVIVLGIIHASDAAKSYYLASKGLMPFKRIRYSGE